MAENKDDTKSGRVKQLWEWVKENSLSLRMKAQKRRTELFFFSLLVGLGLLLFRLWDVFGFSSLIEGASDGTGAHTPVTFSNLSEFIRAAFIGVGVIGAGYGLVLAAKRTEKFATQVENSQAQLFNDRLGRGVELLSNEELTLRSAGVRILEDLGGNSSPQETALIINMLKDFLNDKGKLGEIKESLYFYSNNDSLYRDTSQKQIYEKLSREQIHYRGAPISMSKTSREERIDIESYLNCILNLTDNNWADTSCEEFEDLDFRYLQLGRGRENSLKLLAIHCDFFEARINLTAFKNLYITDCNITETKFRGESGAEMNFVQCCGFGAEFLNINIEGKLFQLSNFSFAIFEFSTFSKVRFNNCTLQDAKFVKVTFTDVTFDNSDLSCAILRNAIFEDVKFENSNLLCADFSGADLAGASGITQEEFSKIIHNKDDPPINLPEGLKLPKDGAYYLQTSNHDALFVESNNEMLSGRSLDEVRKELLKLQTDCYKTSLPHTKRPIALNINF